MFNRIKYPDEKKCINHIILFGIKKTDSVSSCQPLNLLGVCLPSEVICLFRFFVSNYFFLVIYIESNILVCDVL